MGVFFCIIWFVIFCGCVHVFLYHFKNWISPRLTAVATVVEKKKVVFDNTYMFQIVFRMENGEVLTMYVPRSDYKLLVPGDAGRLTAKRTKYISFERC